MPVTEQEWQACDLEERNTRFSLALEEAFSVRFKNVLAAFLFIYSNIFD